MGLISGVGTLRFISTVGLLIDNYEQQVNDHIQVQGGVAKRVCPW